MVGSNVKAYRGPIKRYTTKDRGCWGITKKLRWCQRKGAWLLFCGDHRLQPVIIILLILLPIIADTAGVISIFTKPNGTITSMHDSLKELSKKLIKANHKELIEKYPYGYVVFIITDRKEIVIPEESILQERYEINWNESKVIELSNQNVMIRLPGIYNKKTRSYLGEHVSGGLRRVGLLNKDTFFGLDISTEILADDKDGLICILGFSMPSG